MAARQGEHTGLRCGLAVSIHARPRMAARHAGAADGGALDEFQSTRDHEWPRDRSSRAQATARRRFQSTRDHEWPRDRAIFGPHRYRWFQSTRDHEWPRDPRHQVPARANQRFNPRATTNGRATASFAEERVHPQVSIHARPRMAARLAPARRPRSCAGFNPRATTNGRATGHAGPTDAALARFNPRATTNGRATRRGVAMRFTTKVSIHARPRMAARPARRDARRNTDSVSIHARPRMAARRRHGRIDR